MTTIFSVKGSTEEEDRLRRERDMRSLIRAEYEHLEQLDRTRGSAPESALAQLYTQAQVSASDVSGAPKRLTAQDVLAITSAISAVENEGVGRANAFRDMTGRGGTFSSGGTGSSVATALGKLSGAQDDEMLSAIINNQSQAGLKTLEDHREWYTAQGYPAFYFEDARKAFIKAQQEFRAEDPYESVGTLWNPNTHEAVQFKNNEEKHEAMAAGFTSSTRPELFSNIGTLWNSAGKSKNYKNKKEEYKIRQEGYDLSTPPPDGFKNVGTLWDSQGNSKTYQGNEEKLGIMDDGYNRTSPDAGYEVGTLWNRDTGASANYTTREQEVLLRQRGYKYTSPKPTDSDPLRVVFDTSKKRVVWRLDSVIKSTNAETEDYYLPVSADKGINNAFVMAGILNGIDLEFIQKYQRSGLSGMDAKMSEKDLKTLQDWIEFYSKDINKWHTLAKMVDPGSQIGTITVNQ